MLNQKTNKTQLHFNLPGTKQRNKQGRKQINTQTDRQINNKQINR